MSSKRPDNRVTRGLLDESNCLLCNQTDNSDMVQCDSCDAWFHFICVGVTQDIENQDWKCRACIEKSKNPEVVSITSERKSNRCDKISVTTSKSGRRIKLELQRLEEQRRIQEEFVNKKYELLIEQEDDNSSIGQVEKIENIQKWIDNKPTSSGFSILTSPIENIKTTASKLKDQSFQFPSENMVLSSQQIAARHGVTKELPIFNGNPESWPLFISNFEKSTNTCGFSNDENLIRLQKCLRGKALEAVRWQLLMPENVPKIIFTLKTLFGRPEFIIENLIRKIRSEPPVKSDKLETYVTFALSVQNLCATIEASGMQEHLSNPSLLHELVNRLPMQLKLDWAIYKQKSEQIGSLKIFSAWLFEIAQAANEVSDAYMESYDREIKYQKQWSKGKNVLNTHTENNISTSCQQEKNERNCWICKGTCSSIQTCKKFIGLTRSEKWNAVKQYNICRTCLGYHGNRRCLTKIVCGIDCCTAKHHQLLHGQKREVQTIHNVHRNSSRSILFRILPVLIYSENKTIKTYAFFDEGSSLTLIENNLAEQLNMKGEIEPLCLKWTANTHRVECDSKKVSFKISGIENTNNQYCIFNARTVKSLDLPTQTIASHELQAQYSHLSGLPIHSYKNAKPQILIGLDNLKLALPLKCNEGAQNEPVAAKTRLGWTVYGKNKYNESTSVCHQYHNFHICECEKNDNMLQQLLKQFYILDFQPSEHNKKIEAEDDRRARILMENTLNKLDERYEIGLLWKYDSFKIPDSYYMAKNRLLCLERKLARNPELTENMKKQIQEYVQKGYARKLEPKEVLENHPSIWYLPIFTVTNPNKPGKVRIVWDAAAKTEGISLNSMLLKGPDMLASLPSVLYRFRERAIAIVGDIKEMFHQVKIREQDQHAQRFLWRDCKCGTEPDIYVMCVMTFGASCSPSCAQFVKNENAKKFKQKYPRATESILKSHYVDDLLDSVNTEKDAIQLANEIKFVHLQAGFEIRNWASNSRRVLETLETDINNLNKNMDIGTDVKCEKVLGMFWCTTSDCFTYSLRFNKTNKDILSGNQRPTKREVLRTQMSVYDPLGLISHILIYIKILMQDIWKSPISWDEKINDNQFEKWLDWIKQLPQIESIRIPRCYLTKNRIDEYETQLHIFVDASEEAFAAVAYLRSCKDTDIQCALVGSKTRVAPLKYLSIPRLELEAAVLGARLAANIIEQHSIKFTKRYFWTDSNTVLSWIKSDQRKYRQFVACRIGEILEKTEALEWKKIPTDINIADKATKWKNLATLQDSTAWFHGPAFLFENESQWPKNVHNEVTEIEELRPHLAHQVIKLPQILDPMRFSKWERMVNTQVYVMRFCYNLLSIIRQEQKIIGIIQSNEYQKAEFYLYRQAQWVSFPDEMTILQKKISSPCNEKYNVEKSSSLFKLSPYIDEEGILRIMKGRIDAAKEICDDMKRPIIMPKDNRITQLLIDFYHRKYHHQNSEIVVNELRQKFYITALRVIVKRTGKDCQWCKNNRAKPEIPEMAPLPPARLATFTRPFTYVGIDYFGPITVVVGRRLEKRWGVIFTCLTIRAIHIEIAYTLSTDSCIMCLRNFIARRGTPREIYSDNGTNFHGAERELKNLIKNIEPDKIAEVFNSSDCKWLFIPPSAPHMGGSWERLIRAIKSTLYAINPTKNPSDELLRSMLMEVEKVINSRPLTYVPLEEENDEAITPNHLLLGTSNGEKSVGEIPTESNTNLRKNWMISQQYANQFWRRWIKQYLPTITRRTKWFKNIEPLKKDDIVIIVDETNPRNVWLRGKIIESKKSNDNQIRRVTVQTKNGLIERPVSKIAKLDVRK